MNRLLLYTWAISVGIMGFVVGIVASEKLDIDQPALSLVAGLFGVIAACVTGYISSLLVAKVNRMAMRVMLLIGFILFVVTQYFYWVVMVFH